MSTELKGQRTTCPSGSFHSNSMADDFFFFFNPENEVKYCTEYKISTMIVIVNEFPFYLPATYFLFGTLDIFYLTLVQHHLTPGHWPNKFSLSRIYANAILIKLH